MLTQPLIYTIILNWNGWRDTLECLESIQELNYSNYHILLIDNDSKDDSVEQIKNWTLSQKSSPRLSTHFDTQDISNAGNKNTDCLVTILLKGLTLIESHNNLGFSGGCNLGITYALQQMADYVFLLNNDATVVVDTLAELLAVSKEADAAIVGARVLDANNHQNLFVGRKWPQQLFWSQKLKPDLNRSFWESSYAEGSSILIRRDVLETRLTEHSFIFNPSLFMYCEDTDLCIYAKSKGYKCFIARDAIIYHKLAASSGGQGNPRSYYYITRNRIYLANRWLSFPMKVCFHIYYAPSRYILILLKLFRSKEDGRYAGAVTSGLTDGYKGIKGKWANH